MYSNPTLAIKQWKIPADPLKLNTKSILKMPLTMCLQHDGIWHKNSGKVKRRIEKKAHIKMQNL